MFLLFLLRLYLLDLLALEFLLTCSFCNLIFNKSFRSVLMGLALLSCWSIRSLALVKTSQEL